MTNVLDIVGIVLIYLNALNYDIEALHINISSTTSTT